MLTHIYLLLGCALPSFLCPSASEVLPSTVYPLSLYLLCKSRQWDEPGKTSRLTLVTDAGAPDGATSTATPVGRAHRWHWRYCCLYVCNPRSLSLFRARTRVACVHGESFSVASLTVSSSFVESVPVRRLTKSTQMWLTLRTHTLAEARAQHQPKRTSC